MCLQQSHTMFKQCVCITFCLNNMVYMFTITDINNFTKLVTPTRLELVTPTLKVWCSTNWAKRSSVFNKKAYMWSLQTILRSHYKYKTWTNFCSVLSFFCGDPQNWTGFSGFSVQRIDHLCQTSIDFLYLQMESNQHLMFRRHTL